MTQSPKSESPALMGWLCIALSLFPIARGLRLLPVQSGDAPDWVILLCGFIFIISGLMIRLGRTHERLNHFFAALFTATMGTVGLWVAVFSPDEGMGGGLPFLAREQNIVVARCVFGVGTLFSFWLCGYAIQQISKRKI